MRSVACVLCTLSMLLVFSSAAPAAQASSPRMNAGERAIVRAINRARASHGVRALRGHRRLARAADAHTRSMLRADYFAHGAFASRVRRYVRSRRVGETIAMTTRCSARRVVRMWMHSAPHRAVFRLTPAQRMSAFVTRPSAIVCSMTCSSDGNGNSE